MNLFESVCVFVGVITHFVLVFIRLYLLHFLLRVYIFLFTLFNSLFYSILQYARHFLYMYTHFLKI